MPKRVLFDSDVLLDCILKREPHYVESVKAFAKALNGKVIGCISARSGLNIAYILRKNISKMKLDNYY